MFSKSIWPTLLGALSKVIRLFLVGFGEAGVMRRPRQVLSKENNNNSFVKKFSQRVAQT